MSGRPGAAQRVEFRVACCLLWLRACLLSTPPQGPGAQVPGPDGRARIRKNLHPREGGGSNPQQEMELGKRDGQLADRFLDA